MSYFRKRLRNEMWGAMNHSMRDRHYRTRAIVLQSRDLGESDRILVVFSLLHGKMGVIAKGARKATSRTGPYLDYFAEVQLDLTKGRDLDVVTGVSSVNPHLQLRTNIDAYGHAAHLAELVRDLTEERQESAAVYDLLAGSLAVLGDGVDPWHVTRHFELGLLHAIGYQPDLIHCVQCQRDLQAEPNGYSVALGGMLCPGCGGADRSALALSVNAQKYLRLLERKGLAAVVGLRLDPDIRHQIGQVLLASLRHIGERDFTSLRVLGAMTAPAKRTS